MEVTIQDILNSPKLEGFKVLTGKNSLDLELSTVTVLDAPDGPTWLRGKEFVLTSGYMFEDKNALNVFVQGLINAKASCLAIKMGRYSKQISEEVIALAEQHHFPILLIPYHYVWSDIISVYYQLKEHSIDMTPGQIYSLYVESKWGFLQMARKLAEYINCEMLVFSGAGMVSYENQAAEKNHLKELLQNKKLYKLNDQEIKKVGHHYVLIKKGFGLNPVDGHVLLFRSKNRAYLKELLELFFMLQRFAMNEGRLKVDMEGTMEFLLKNLINVELSDKHLQEYEKQFPYLQNKYFFIALLSLQDNPRVLDEIKMLLKDRNKIITLYQLEDPVHSQIVCLFEINEENHQEAFLSMRSSLRRITEQHISRMDKEDFLAIGKMQQGLTSILTSYRQAKISFEIGKNLYINREFYSYESIEVFDQMLERRESLNFYEIELLLRHQEKMNFDLVETLSIYVNENNFKLAAKRLFLHENTLRYRVQKIEEILQLDFSNRYVLYYLFLKLNLWNVIQNNPQ